MTDKQASTLTSLIGCVFLSIDRNRVAFAVFADGSIAIVFDVVAVAIGDIDDVASAVAVAVAVALARALVLALLFAVRVDAVVAVSSAVSVTIDVSTMPNEG